MQQLCNLGYQQFQSTPPTRRATGRPQLPKPGAYISIHAPHTEGDKLRGSSGGNPRISIHAPHTEGDSKNRQII